MEIINESVENYFVNYKIYLKSKKQKKITFESQFGTFQAS
jgi:hypothetical protein